MIYLDHMKLAERLGRGEISERGKFWYYFIFMLVISLSLTSYARENVYLGIKLNIFDYLNDSAFVMLTVLAMLVSFRINASGDNRDFIARSICLGLSVSIQLGIVVTILLAIALALTIVSPETILAVLPERKRPLQAGPLELAIGVTAAIYFNGQIIRGIKRAANQNGASSSSALRQ